MAPEIQKRIGKAQARKELSTLIETVASGAGAVAITDHGKKAAVLLSKHEYEWLCACARKTDQPKSDPRGFFVLSNDQALDQATREIEADFDNSITKTVSEL